MLNFLRIKYTYFMVYFLLIPSQKHRYLLYLYRYIGIEGAYGVRYVICILQSIHIKNDVPPRR